MAQELLTPTEVADQLRVDTRTLSRWRSEGNGPTYVRVGRAIRYDQLAVSNWLGSRSAGSLAEERNRTTAEGKTRHLEENGGAQR